MFHLPILVLCAVAMVLHIEGKVSEKRLILHSDEDIAAAIQAMQAEIQTLKESKPTTDLGSTYIRWGRTSCQSNGTELVYKGYAAGNWYGTSGGGADYLCLTQDPQWGVYDDSAQSLAGKVFGAEYQFGEQFDDGGAAFFGQALFQHDAPCAACRTARATSMMIPGTNVCPPGWTSEYSGYLVSAHYGRSAASNYACLDSRPEVEAGDVANENGKLMYVTEAQCGTLKCPPYVQNRELTCAVCSK